MYIQINKTESIMSKLKQPYLKMNISRGRAGGQGGIETEDIGESNLTLVEGLVLKHCMPITVMNNFVNPGALIKNFKNI